MGSSMGFGVGKCYCRGPFVVAYYHIILMELWHCEGFFLASLLPVDQYYKSISHLLLTPQSNQPTVDYNESYLTTNNSMIGKDKQTLLE